MVSILKIWPELEKRNLNVKIVYVASTQLFNNQPQQYHDTIVYPDWVLQGIQRFASHRQQRLEILRAELEAVN
jgi:transketolase